MRALAAALLLLVSATTLTAEPDLVEDLIFFDPLLGDPIDMGPVNRATVRGFEILYATPGSGDVSEIAGHLLLRIRLNNNPLADSLGIENPHDLVISFLADTESGRAPRAPQPLVVQEDCRRHNWFNLVNQAAGGESPMESLWQSLKGLCGGFPIVMDRQTLGHALKSYTVEQDRTLLRYRLNLSPDAQGGLLDHLSQARTNESPAYFFFSENCGSYLVKVVGQGIGDPDIANFEPLVAPPHALLGNMVRKGLATRITPAFYSYRQQGFIAQRLLQHEYAQLMAQAPTQPWPPPAAFADRRETTRARAIEEAGALAAASPELRPGLYRLAAWVQEADMAFSDKELVCENYTSAAAAAARTLQAQWLAAAGPTNPAPLDTGAAIRNHHAPAEAAAAAIGSPHTGLYTLSAGLGYYASNASRDAPACVLSGAVLRQELGDPSRLAMQRAGSLELGGAEVVFDEDALREWQLTVLRLRKFRETLERVPSCLASTRGFGMGLSVLELRQTENNDRPYGTIAGAAILGNLASSAHHEDFLAISAGLDIAMSDDANDPVLRAETPVGVESLVTLGAAMAFQWRNAATCRFAPESGSRPGVDAVTSLAHRLGEIAGRELWGGLAVEHHLQDEDADSRRAEATTLVQAFVTVNRW